MKIKDFKKLFNCVGGVNKLKVVIYNIHTCETIKGYENYWDFNNDPSNEKYKISKINGILLFTNSIDIWVE